MTIWWENYNFAWWVLVWNLASYVARRTEVEAILEWGEGEDILI